MPVIRTILSHAELHEAPTGSSILSYLNLDPTTTQIANQNFSIHGKTIKIRKLIPSKFGEPPINRLSYFKEVVFPNIEVINCCFDHIDFTKATFNGTRFTHCNFNATSFKQANLSGVTFDNCLMDECEFSGTLREVNFKDCSLKSATFLGAKLVDVAFKNFIVANGANFLTSDLEDTELPPNAGVIYPQNVVSAMQAPVIVMPWNFGNEISHSSWVAFQRMEEYQAMPIRMNYIDDFCPIALRQELENILNEKRNCSPKAIFEHAENYPNNYPAIVNVIQQAKTFVNASDGVFIPGGGHICPLFYGEECLPIDPRRDLADFALLYAAKVGEKHENQPRIPVFGSCKGLQVLHVYLGGKLYQHLSDVKGATPALHRDHIENYQKIQEAKSLTCLNNSEDVTGYSWHSQSCQEPLGIGLRSLLTADGIIEAVEGSSDRQWIGAVLFHPEFKKDFEKDDPTMNPQREFSEKISSHSIGVYKDFIAAAALYKQSLTSSGLETS